MKRKGKPKTPAPGFHLPAELWDQAALPTLRPKNEDGLPIAGGQGVVLFRFHVDQQVIQANPIWAEGLYDNPPIPEGDMLLPQLAQIMDATVYQHLRPLVKYMRDSSNVARLSTSEEVQEILAGPEDQASGSIDPMVDAFLSARPVDSSSSELGNANLDLSLETLVSMTQNSYMATNPLANQLALAAMSTTHDVDETGADSFSRKSKFWPGSSQQARKMGKRTASDVPEGAVEPVPKRIKGEAYTWQDGQEGPDKDLAEDADFVNAL